MKRLALITATTLMLATTASAGGIAFSFPTLTYPTTTDVTVAKDCLPTTDAALTCTPQE